MGVRDLIQRSLRSGVSLAQDADHVTPADAVTALGIVGYRVGADGVVVLHAKLGQIDLPAFRTVVYDMTGLVFGQHGWEIAGTKRRAAGEIAHAFVDHVCTEFLSSPCNRCSGYGWRGRRLDTIRHCLDTCPTCKGVGMVEYPRVVAGRDEQIKSGRMIKRGCQTCLGKRLVIITEAIKAGKLRVCSACSGTGRTKGSATARAKALGCSRSHVYRVWAERFTAVLRELRMIEKVAVWTVEDYLA